MDSLHRLRCLPAGATGLVSEDLGWMTSGAPSRKPLVCGVREQSAIAQIADAADAARHSECHLYAPGSTNRTRQVVRVKLSAPIMRMMREAFSGEVAAISSHGSTCQVESHCSWASSTSP